MTRNAWIITLSSIACIAVIAAVVWAARGRGAPSEPGLVPSYGGSLPLPRYRADPELAGCTSLDPEMQPVFEVDLEGGRLDFGKVKQDILDTREITFRNTGETTLCILRIASPCSCMKASLVEPAKRRYEPGESGTLRVVLDSSGRQGEVEKTVTITTNELDNPVHTFMCRCDIALGVVAAPPAIMFGSVAKGVPTKGTTTLRSPKDDADWKVTEVVGTRLTGKRERVAYTFEVREQEDPRFHRLALTVGHPGLLDEGRFRDKLVVRTTHPERPLLELESSIVVVPRIRAEPPRLDLGYVRSGTSRPPIQIRIVPGGAGIDFAVTGVRIEPPDGEQPRPGGEGFEVEFGMTAGRGWVDVRYDGKTRRGGRLEAVVVVETDDSRTPEVRVPVAIQVRETN